MRKTLTTDPENARDPPDGVPKKHVLASIVAHLPSGVLLCRQEAHGRFLITYANASAHSLLAARLSSDPKGATLDSAWPELCAHQGERLVAVVRGQGGFERAAVPYGEQPGGRQYRVRSFPIPGDHLAIVFEDVTERQRAEKRLRDSDRRFRLLAEASAEGIAVHDSGTIRWSNKALGRLMGVTPSRLRGRPLLDLFPDESRDEIACRLAEGTSRPFRTVAVREDSTLLPVLVRFSHVKQEDRQFSILTLADLTVYEEAKALARSNSALEHLALTDGLTGAYNRRFFEAAYDAQWARCSRREGQVSLLLVDVDHFKCINDQHGHPVGDAVLKAIASRILSGKRASDVVARYGGEEFVILLPDTSHQDALEVAHRLRSEIAQQRVDLKSVKTLLQVTISVGVASSPLHAQSKAALLAAADKALYRAKATGRNQVASASETL